MKKNLNYPIALILIILFAGYLLYTGYFQKPQVNLDKYQEVCSRYLQDKSGTYSHDQMQLLVEKINYLFPGPADKLAVAAERQLKTCSDQLAAKLKAGK